MRTYKSTRNASFAAYVVQSIVNNFTPLLFIIFQDTFSVSFSSLSMLVLINFLTQLVVDFTSTFFVDRIGYRRCLVAANLISALGLLLLPILPYCMPPMLGLCIATVVMAIGSGLIEVLVSPLIENLPFENKAAQMSLLHSFFCWGQVAVVIITTLYLHFFGSWHLLPVLWAIVPGINCINFLTVPIVQPPIEKRSSVTALLKNKTFLLMMLLMLCGGASECAMSQWASAYAERGLKIPKVLGDLFGPCGFAVFMGVGRVLYGLWGNKIDIRKALIICTGLCILCYGIAALASPVFALIGCIFCGFSVSLMWPGCFSLSTRALCNQSTAMFALLAMAGDLGCSIGPGLTGIMSDISTAWHLPLSGLKFGLLTAMIFPIVLLIGLLTVPKEKKKYVS